MILEKFEDFNIEKRNGSIMLSAPHCYNQLRNNKIKKRETKSGILVKNIASNLRCSCIYKTRFYNNDPNWDNKSTYREQLVNFINSNNIKCLIDIHTMRAERETDICIGTNCLKNIQNRTDLLEIVVKSLKNYQFHNVEIDKPFNASHCNVISHDVAIKCRIPCFQIEINNRFMHRDYKDFNFEMVQSAIAEVIIELNKIL